MTWQAAPQRLLCSSDVSRDAQARQMSLEEAEEGAALAPWSTSHRQQQQQQQQQQQHFCTTLQAAAATSGLPALKSQVATVRSTPRLL